MKPIIFARIANMTYYRGITEWDKPYGGGTYVADTGLAHECYNFKPEANLTDDGGEYCLGFVMHGGAAGIDAKIHLEKINGCEAMKSAELIDDAIVVFCATSLGSKSMRVVGFYKNATVYRNTQGINFDTVEGAGIYKQHFNFMAKKEDCVLLPYTERHSNSQWYVPQKGRLGAKIGFGRSNIWFASGTNENAELKKYVENMIRSVEEYDGENWIYKEVI